MNSATIGYVEFCGLRYDVIVKETIVYEGDELLGQVDYEQLTITIKDNLPKERFEMVLLHEFIHVISAGMDLKFDEHVTELMSTALYQCGFRVPLDRDNK